MEQQFKFSLPEHLCEADDPLKKAQAYSLQLLLIANQLGGVAMTTELIEWLRNLDDAKLNSMFLVYQKKQRRAEKAIPFIRDTLQKHLESTESGYKMQAAGSLKDVTTPLEVDGFLFEDLQEALDHAGLPSDRFCMECKSHDVQEIPINFQSYCVDSLINLFGVLLKDFDCGTVAIVGSREGALAYGAFLYCNAKSIISFESSEHLRRIQCNMVSKYGMQSRLHVTPAEDFMNTDVINCVDILICEDMSEYPTEVFGKRLHDYVQARKVLVCKNDCNNGQRFPFLKDLLQYKRENIMSCQEFIVIRQ